MIEHLLNRRMTVMRPHTTGDGGGGQTTEWRVAGTVRARVDQPTATERETGDQNGADISHPVYLLPRADVRRGDRLVDGALDLLVLKIYGPSAPKYRRADCEERQSEEAT